MVGPDAEMRAAPDPGSPSPPQSRPWCGLRRAWLAAVALLVAARSAPAAEDDDDVSFSRRRRLWLLDQRIAAYSDPKSVRSRFPARSVSRRRNCQIVYVLGVEGSIHHGFMPVIRSLAESQVDPVTGTPYDVVKGHPALRAAIFGSDEERDLPLNSQELVQSTLEQMCPSANKFWKKHIIIEGNSFPSGTKMKRRQDWLDMTPEQIAQDSVALSHPTNLYQFYEAYSEYVDIKFIVLHRPYLETIASHLNFDKGPEGHSNVISGFLVLLSRFLMGHLNTAPTPDGDKAAIGPLWTIVCAEQLSSRQPEYLVARNNVLVHLANFLGWPQRSCPRCFDSWKESTKASPQDRMGKETTRLLLDHAKAMEGIWPPSRPEDVLPEQQCRM